MLREIVVDMLIKCGVVAVIRIKEPGKLIKVAEAIYEGGIKAIEITMTVPDALSLIGKAANQLGDRMLIGVGSVLNASTAQQAIDAGAKFVVSPVFKKEIIEASHNNNVPAIPGAFTPTEIQNAYEAGADVVKVFPADVLGMAFFKGILAPMPHLKLMPTGGVTLSNAGDWLKVGACAVGVGNALLDKHAIDEENYSKLTENAKLIINSIENYRSTLVK